MPRLAIDYSKSIIYKICCKDTNITDCYIGSTTNFTNRKNRHKSNCNSNSKKGNLKVYRFIREYGGWDNWDMILIEIYPCTDKLELLKREREFFEFFNSTLNTLIPSRTERESSKIYNTINREIIAENAKEKIGCRTCKCMVIKKGFIRHTRSKKHINNLP